MRSLVPRFFKKDKDKNNTRSASQPPSLTRKSSAHSCGSANTSRSASPAAVPLQLPTPTFTQSRPPSDHASNPWVHAFVVVKFDLELGQVIDRVVPDNVFTPEQLKEICHLSFPDSNSHLVNDTCYTIKLRRRNCKFKYNYGYVYFRQKRDTAVQRGYVQESLVLVSRWPFVSLMEAAVRAVAKPFFSMCPVSPTPVSTEVPATVTALPLGGLVQTVGGRGMFLPASPTTGDSLPTSPTSQGYVDGTPDMEPSSPRRRFSFMFVPAAAATPTALATSAVGVASLIIVATSVSVSCRWNIEPRYQLLYDALGEINAWSPPDSCASYSLKFLGHEFEWRAPKFTVTARTTTVNCSSRDHMNPQERRVASVVRQNQWFASPTDGRLQDKLAQHQYVFAEVPLYSTFQTCLRRLWQLWELAVLGEPLCVLSRSPSVSSSATLAVVSLIHPITSCVDFRPYYSVQDVDCKLVARLGRRGKAPSDEPPLDDTTAAMQGKGPLVGVTNPYFVKVFKDWPHILTLNSHGTDGGVDGRGMSTSPAPHSPGSVSPPPMAKPRKLAKKNSRERLLTEFKETFITNRSFVVNSSAEHIKPVLDQLIDKSNPLSDQINTGILRNHFLKMSDAFLLPLERCFEETWVADTRLFILKHAGAREMFTRALFKTYLREGATPYDKRLFKRDQKAVLHFYDRFIEGCHFTNWVEERIAERYKLDLQVCDMDEVVAPLGESQRIELFMLLCCDLVNEERKIARDPALVGLLQKQLTVILDNLPEVTHKPLLRRHYRGALGEKTLLPAWAIEEEDTVLAVPHTTFGGIRDPLPCIDLPIQPSSPPRDSPRGSLPDRSVLSCSDSYDSSPSQSPMNLSPRNRGATRSSASSRAMSQTTATPPARGLPNGCLPPPMPCTPDLLPDPPAAKPTSPERI